ncbi:MAG: hypothetical protein CBC35_04385 [Planctomycetes bacterium TMED75]|nr:class III aminotransferase [Planctomycetaceae bacterium]OUU94212.1 MAG: hypothetical protein CBC35_04385 [Planctomycetes bacterium TMED75]
MTEEQEQLEFASRILHKHWGRKGRLQRLPGENFNALLRAEGNCHVLKITGDPNAEIQLEQAVLDRLAEAELPVPRTLASADGEHVVRLKQDGLEWQARLQRFQPGQQWRTLGSDAARLELIGRQLGEVHQVLSGLEKVEPRSTRTHQWDLAQALQHRSQIQFAADTNVRQHLERCLHLYAACALPHLADCPQGMLHGDFNDENILLEDERISGILDVGDCQRGALVQDLAICLSYALQHEGIGLAEAGRLLKGYDAVRTLEDVELDLVHPLVLARLATSTLISLARRRAEPNHSTWFSHEDSTLETIGRLIGFSPRTARSVLSESLREQEPLLRSPEELLAHRKEHLGPSLSISYQRPLHIVRGAGQYLHAEDGEPYLDLVNNVCHVGHCHPVVVEAISQQAAVLNTNTRYLHENIERFAERLVGTLPDELDTCFLVNSGSEANELALRIARAATGAHDVLVVDGAYHGSTSNCVAMSPYKFNGTGGSGPPDWVHVVPIPDGYRGEIRGHDEAAGAGYALEVGRVVGEACAKGRSIAGFFVEPILSCGGQVPLPTGYLRAAFDHVHKAGGLAIADEVQVGFGRVGEAFWGFQLHDVVPDIVVMGKPIGNGHPLGAVVTTRRIAEAFDNGMEFFSTFGGNPVSCACGIAVLEVIEKQALQERANRLGKRFIEGLRRLQERHRIIGDVRGSGLFIGIELVRDHSTLEPAATEASQVVNLMRERGILLSTDGPLHNVIKIKPPMVLDHSDIEMALRQLDDVLGTFT